MNELLNRVRETHVPRGSAALWWLCQMGLLVKMGETVLCVDYFATEIPERQAPPPVPAGEMAGVDIFLGTHDHLDHIDHESWRTWAETCPGAVFVFPERHRQAVLADGIDAGRCRGLNDGESVISMDIFIDGLQRTFDDLAKKEGVKAALIMDVLGNVVVHSKHDEIAKNYLMDGSEYRKKLAERVRNIAGRADYYDTEPSDGEILFAEKVNNNWCAVVILDEANLLGYLRYMNIILILFLALVFLAWYGIAKTIDRKYREAEADALSNLYNRRSGEERIRKLLASGTKGVFILLDIDKFKLINDRFGHDVGDLVIAAVADSLRKTFRDSDVVFRLGGDEFAVFASGINQEESKERLIQRLHAEISRINIPELRGHPVTVSAGTGDYGGETEDTYETLYQRADKNMYESKRKKRKE